MKTQRVVYTFAILTLVTLSCKKEKPEEPEPAPPRSNCITILDAETNKPVPKARVDVGIANRAWGYLWGADSLGRVCIDPPLEENEFVSSMYIYPWEYIPEQLQFTKQNPPPEVFKIFRANYVKVRLINIPPADDKDYIWICSPPSLTGFWGKVDTTVLVQVYPFRSHIRFLLEAQHNELVAHTDSIALSFATSDTAHVQYKY